MVPSTTRKLFFSVLAETEKKIDSFVKAPGVDMIRHRSCSFIDTVLATINMSSGRTNTELFNFFMAKKQHLPSKSAFSQQRQKFNNQLFPHILKEFNNAIPFKKTFKGYHLIAIDGSDLNLPTDKNDTVYRVKQARNNNYYYQMHINAMFDICENRYHSILIQPRPEMNEHEAFMELVNNGEFHENTIFSADRGYCSLNSIANLCDKNKLFLIRAKSPDSNGSFLHGLIEKDTPSDSIVTIAITRHKKRLKNVTCDVVKCIRNDRRFDLIAPNDKEKIYTINLRCTCIELTDGNYEYLISNLPMDEFSAADLKELYWKRWSIETSFRSLKYALSLSFLHSVKRELIIQEVYAKVILYNFTALIHSYAQESKELLRRNQENKYSSKVSFEDAVPISKMLVTKEMKNSIIKTLLLRHLTAFRMGVASGRHVRSQTVNSLNNRA